MKCEVLMPYIEWDEQYSVKNAEMDRQHQMLFDYINEFYTAIDFDRRKSDLVAILDKVIQYTHFHFLAEEQLMRDVNYPDYEKHKNIHKELVTRVLKLKEQLISTEDKGETAEEIKSFLKNWLTQHIQGIDKKYSLFL